MSQVVKFHIINVISKFSSINWNNKFVQPVGSRDKHDLNVINHLKSVVKNKKEISVSAVYRVKNGTRFLEASMLSVAPLCKEIIVVDNQSTDNIKEVVERIKERIKNTCEVKFYEYDHKLSKAGNGYKDRVSINPKSSLSEFYNFAFSKATCDYIMKVDAHYIFIPSSIEIIYSKLKKNPLIVKFRGQESFGAIMAFEPFIFNKKLGFYFEDSEFFEVIRFKNKLSVMEKFRSIILKPLFIHVKRIGYIEGIK